MEARDRQELSTRALAIVFAVALAVRLVALAELAGSPWNEVLLGDARFFDDWGRRIAAGDWRGSEVFYQAPLYPYFLGGVYALFGHVPGLVRGLQCALAALAAVWIAQGTCRLASPRAGFVAGVLAALYAPALGYDLQIEKTSFATSTTAWLFLVLARGGSRTPRAACGAGLALGVLTLLRENAFVLLVPLAWAFGRQRVGRGARLASLAAGLALALAPVALRNAAVGGAPLPTAANAGVNFYIGNGAEADGEYRPLVAGRGHPDYEREDARRIAEDLAGHSLTAAGVSRFWFALALQEIAAEPGHFLRLLGHKLRLFAHHSEIMDAVALEVFEDESLTLHLLAWFSFGVLLPLALAGAVLARGRPGTGLALGAGGLLALSIVAFFVVARFRLGCVPFALPFAAIALVEGPTAPRRSFALAALVVGALAAWWPLPSTGDPRATSASNLASELLRRHDLVEAERWARAACERDPSSAEAAFNLGRALRGQGKSAEAVAPFEASMRLEPAYAADCLAELGAIRAQQGDASGARTLLERALALDPANRAAHRYLDELTRDERGASNERNERSE